MPLELYFRPSFERSLKCLGQQQKAVVALILESLSVYYANSCNLKKAQESSPGFFYKQLRKPYFEAGIDKNIRVVIRREGQKCIAVLAGNHDQIRIFLSQRKHCFLDFSNFRYYNTNVSAMSASWLEKI